MRKMRGEKEKKGEEEKVRCEGRRTWGRGRGEGRRGRCEEDNVEKRKGDERKKA